MDWPEIITEGFPGPRDGEPPDLRRDIADELNDHLACAMQRELRRTDDPAAAEHAVLDRFGDPKRIARRLWWDAMKEQIMKDRVMIGMMVLTLLICAAVGFFAWQMMQQGQQVNQAMLAKLETLGKPAAQPAVPGDWAKVTFRCYEGEGRDKPASDRRIVLDGKPFNDVENEVFHQSTDKQGMTTFGPFRPGRYTWTTSSPDYGRGRSALTLYPGQALEKIVNFPPADAQTDVTIKANWPDELRNKDVLLYCRFQGSARLGDTHWSIPEQTVVTAADGKVLTGYGSRSVAWPPAIWSAGQPIPGMPIPLRSPSGRGGGPSAVPAPFSLRRLPARGNRLALFSPQEKSIQTEEHLRCPAARYSLSSVHVLSRVTHPEDATVEWLECARVDYNPPPTPPSFDAQLGRLNTWTIDLTEELLKQVRENLPQAEPVDMLTEIELRVAWPEDLAKQGYPVLCNFAPAATTPEGASVNEWWSINEWMPFVGADGKLVWGYRYEPSQPRPSPDRDLRPGAGQPDLNVIQPEGVELQGEARTRRPATTYWLTAISVLAPTEDARAPQVKWHGIAAKEFLNPAARPAFVAEKDKVNTWTIKLSDDLLKEVREYVTRQSQLGDTLADIEFRVDWPTDLADRKLPIYCAFAPAERPPKIDRGEQPPIEEWQAVILADGRILKDYNGTTRPAEMPDRVVIEARDAGELKYEPHIRRPAATYVLAEAYILSPVNKPTEPSKWQSFADWRSGSPAGADCTFVADPGRLNTWTIKIPQELLSALGKPPSQIPSVNEPASQPARLGPGLAAPMRPGESAPPAGRGRN